MSSNDDKLVSGGLPFKVPSIPSHVHIAWVVALIVIIIALIIFGYAGSMGFITVTLFTSIAVTVAMVYFSQPEHGLRPMQGMRRPIQPQPQYQPQYQPQPQPQYQPQYQPQPQPQPQPQYQSQPQPQYQPQPQPQTA